jgi:hypothetical protein
VYANDSLGTLDNSSTRNFTENTPPSVTATITPVSPTTLDNLTCTVGGWIDPQDAPGNYTFQWYNGTTFKFSSGLTTSTTYTLLSTNLSIGDTWNCTIRHGMDLRMELQYPQTVYQYALHDIVYC